MLPDDLLKTAERLVDSGPGKPKQSDLRRAVSTTYFAMFHTLAKCCADVVVGSSGSQRSPEAWQQVYRALEHGFAKNSCSNKMMMSKFPREIQDFAHAFVEMQIKRHQADYDPNEKFFKSAVLVDIGLIELIIQSFKRAALKDKRAFAVLVLLKSR